VKLRLVITERVMEKLVEKHKVSRAEVVQCFAMQCFANKLGRLLEDDREDHRTTPPTRWFIAETDAGRELKIVFVREDDVVFLKSAYEPDAEEKRIYNKYAF
jgi:hypothetical protein